MPKLLETYLGYTIYFWSDDENEPIHVHASKGRPVEGATKFWITTDGVELAHNHGNIPQKDLKKLTHYLRSNQAEIVSAWVLRCGHGEMKR